MTLCPYQPNTFCNDGYPSKHDGDHGNYMCDAYWKPAILTSICASEACVVKSTSEEGVTYHIKPCETYNSCPYGEGCLRHRIFKEIPVEMVAKAIEYECNRRGKDEVSRICQEIEADERMKNDRCRAMED